MIESSTFKRLDLAQAVRDELGTGNRLMPRRVDLLTLAKAPDDVAGWLGPQLKKDHGGGLADVVFVDKGSRGARPLHVLTLEDRVLYRALLAALEGALPGHLTARQSVAAFRAAPLEDAANRYITKTDVTAYYEFVDHELLADELLAQALGRVCGWPTPLERCAALGKTAHTLVGSELPLRPRSQPWLPTRLWH